MPAAKKHRAMSVAVLDECPAFPARRTRNGECKYPFDRLHAPGMGLEVSNRNISTVRDALKRWKAVHGAGMEFTVRQVDTNKVRVRRDK